MADHVKSKFQEFHNSCLKPTEKFASCVRNVFSIVPENNLILGLGKYILPPLISSHSPRIIGLVGSNCSFSPEYICSNMVLDAGVSTTGFEPRSFSVHIDSQSIEEMVSTIDQGQLLPLKFNSSQSDLATINSNGSFEHSGDIDFAFDLGFDIAVPLTTGSVSSPCPSSPFLSGR
ncbi:hypothetical protein DSO57_1010197 [Entomophthora muscae]|uniref:Uncharacterized protein n=1 Tax=Entomophthora muscae TaxID=34485 RepID=A0ACC2USN2_9FUNG|nr:hypothetical protein DSO57_1010197 [Entomophthora muscae]